MWQQWGNTPDIAIGASVLYLIPGVPLINGIIDIIEGMYWQEQHDSSMRFY